MNTVAIEEISEEKNGKKLMSIIGTTKSGKQLRYTFWLPEGVSAEQAFADFQNAASLREAAEKYEADVQMK